MVLRPEYRADRHRASPRIGGVRRLPLRAPAAPRLPAARLPAARHQRAQRLRRADGGARLRRRAWSPASRATGPASTRTCAACSTPSPAGDVIGVSLALLPRPRGARRRHQRARHADGRAARQHRHRGGARGAQLRHGAARRPARLLDLRPAARRALRPGARGRRRSSISAASTSSTTATWPPTWRSTAI